LRRVLGTEDPEIMEHMLGWSFAVQGATTKARLLPRDLEEVSVGGGEDATFGSLHELTSI
jgi:hypothetical protein